VTVFRRSIPHPLLTTALTFFIAIDCLRTPLARAENPKSPETAGATLFRDKGCAYCHGANAQGTPKGPSLENVRKKMKAPQIVAQITNGGQKMPSFEDSLSHDEIAQLVAFLRAKRRPQPAPLAAQPAAAPPAQN
jgi:mono/diheme cytochrome c family protein